MSKQPIYKPKRLPLIVLPPGQALFPNAVLRITFADRPDIQALLQRVAKRTKTERIGTSSIAIGCVPLKPRDKKPSKLIMADSEEDFRAAQEVEEDELSSADEDASYANLDDLFPYGTVARIVGFESQNGIGVAIMVEGVSRFRVDEIKQERPYIEAVVTHLIPEPIQSTDPTTRGFFSQLRSLSYELLWILRMRASVGSGDRRMDGVAQLLIRRLENFIGPQRDAQDPGDLADFMISSVGATFDEKLAVLELSELPPRLEKVVEIVGREVSSLRTAMGLKGNQKGSKQLLDMTRRKGGAGNGQPDADQEEDEIADLTKRLEEAKLSPEADKVAQRELKRLQRMSPIQAEYQVCRTYLETLAEIPWTKVTDDQLGDTTMARARKQLDDDHYGLQKIKKRLLEYLAVLKLKQQINQENEAKTKDLKEGDERPKYLVDKSPILLLVGPPGTGKTSLAKSVATALGRKFHRISLGGVRDEAEIRGHRRTYVAAMPGLIVHGLKKVGVANPVILLDEVDKVGGPNFHGDPSAALLEVLDPEQNWSFTDHYLNIPLDLSKVLFIATANSLDTIPPPLLDRMEMISLAGYTSLEKRHIASQYLIPKQIQANGLGVDAIKVPDDVILKVIRSYTREAGVRNLERELGSLCRAKAVEYSEAKDGQKLTEYNPAVNLEDLEGILGLEKFDEERITDSTIAKPGIVTGLVAFSIGGNGSILFIEAADMPGTGKIRLTGKLGEVIKESVEVAMTWVKGHAFVLGLTHDPHEDVMKTKDVHVHCPQGAVPKDGPSAGVAFTIALISLFSGRRVRPNLAMTGEVSLRGSVTAVGGIKEKLIGALSAGVSTVLLPAHNSKDVKDMPQEVKEGLEIIYVRSVWDAMRHVWPEWDVPQSHITSVDSRL